jgi:hypothetical protein
VVFLPATSSGFHGLAPIACQLSGVFVPGMRSYIG